MDLSLAGPASPDVWSNMTQCSRLKADGTSGPPAAWWSSSRSSSGRDTELPVPKYRPAPPKSSRETVEGTERWGPVEVRSELFRKRAPKSPTTKAPPGRGPVPYGPLLPFSESNREDSTPAPSPKTPGSCRLPARRSARSAPAASHGGVRPSSGGHQPPGREPRWRSPSASRFDFPQCCRRSPGPDFRGRTHRVRAGKTPASFGRLRDWRAWVIPLFRERDLNLVTETAWRSLRCVCARRLAAIGAGKRPVEGATSQVRATRGAGSTSGRPRRVEAEPPSGLSIRCSAPPRARTRRCSRRSAQDRSHRFAQRHRVFQIVRPAALSAQRPDGHCVRTASHAGQGCDV